jgi:hypothetical protein
MKTQNLIIYKLNSLYHILRELDLSLNFNIFFIDNENSLNEKLKSLSNFLIITHKKILNIDSYFILKNIPINIFQLVEKINIEFIKVQYNFQSDVKINNYIINLNSREMIKNRISLKLTEKEIKTITYIIKSQKPVIVDELKKHVWNYNLEMETHTVETHIYRLRKKIFNTFGDNKFIISKKKGYQI